MSTFTIDELDREEIEFLPSRVVMTTCNPNPCCRPCSPCTPTVQIYIQVRIGCLLGADAVVRA